MVIINRGTITSILRDNGSLTTGYIYDEFGNRIKTGEEDFLNEAGYTGQIYDSETNLHYMNARYYNSETGQFISKDTYLGEAYSPWTQNLYSYTGNNPVNYVDPTGHYSVSNINAKLAIGRLTKSITGSLVKGNNKSSNKKSSLGKRIKNMFGIDSSTVFQVSGEKITWVDFMPIVAKSGVKVNTLEGMLGNVSRPISLYSEIRSDDILMSSCGVKINFNKSLAVKASIGLDDISLGYEYSKNNTTAANKLIINLSRLRIGAESSTSQKINSITSYENYSNVSINFYTIIMIYSLVNGGTIQFNY